MFYEEEECEVARIKYKYAYLRANLDAFRTALIIYHHAFRYKIMKQRIRERMFDLRVRL